MRPAVLAAFPAFTEGFEGRVACMYLDKLGLVTCGVGNLIDPMGVALPLPWTHGLAGGRATSVEIAAEWQAVKDDVGLADAGWTAAMRATTLRLADDAIDELVRAAIEHNDAILAARFAAWESWPADAQMAAHSMAYAAGPYFWRAFPMFSSACARLDFGTAAAQSHENGVGVEPRNAADRALLLNAAAVLRQGMDPAKVYYPLDVAQG